MLTQAIQGVSNTVLAKLPSANAFRQSVQHIRKENAQAPPNPTSLLELNIPERYKTLDGETFLLVDTGEDEEDNERILIFGRESYSSWAHLVKKLYVDGTFSVCFNKLLKIIFNFRLHRRFSIKCLKYSPNVVATFFRCFTCCCQTRLNELTLAYLGLLKGCVQL